MKIGIIGGGFGLYGYLPALMQLPNISYILPIRYQDFIQSREDIRCFYNCITWVSDDDVLLKSCDCVIIAIPPAQQYDLVKKCLALKNIQYLLLEKPLAATPVLATDLLERLISSGKKFRIGYNFRLTDWGKSLLQQSCGPNQIIWKFKAHHYANQIQNWKRNHAQGGGALRFYGIHIVALLAELGYNDVSFSEIFSKEKNEIETWNAEIMSNKFEPCKISVESNCQAPNFMVIENSGKTHMLSNPFDSLTKHEKTVTDQRIPLLLNGLLDLFTSEQPYYAWYGTANSLWLNIEKRTTLS